MTHCRRFKFSRSMFEPAHDTLEPIATVKAHSLSLAPSSGPSPLGPSTVPALAPPTTLASTRCLRPAASTIPVLGVLLPHSWVPSRRAAETLGREVEYERPYTNHRATVLPGLILSLPFSLFLLPVSLLLSFLLSAFVPVPLDRSRASLLSFSFIAFALLLLLSSLFVSSFFFIQHKTLENALSLFGPSLLLRPSSSLHNTRASSRKRESKDAGGFLPSTVFVGPSFLGPLLGPFAPSFFCAPLPPPPRALSCPFSSVLFSPVANNTHLDSRPRTRTTR